MRELVFEGAGRLTWCELAEPRLEAPTDALVRPVAVTLCDVDRLALRGELPVPGPISFGHEFVAQVVATGDEVRGIETGGLVVAPVQISCGACERCRRGLTAWCSAVHQPAAWGLGPFGGQWPGAFCDLLRVPYASHMLIPVPTGVDPHHVASAGDNIADAWRTVAPHMQTGDDVLIVGGGSIGLYAVAIAIASGAGQVAYVDVDRERCTLAERLGATVAATELDRRIGSHHQVTVDASLNGEGLLTAVRATAPGGVCTCVFPGLGDIVLPGLEMWQRGVRLHVGVANCRAHMPQVLDLVQRGAVRPELVTSEEVAWDDAADSLADPSLKPLVVRTPE